MVEDALRFIGQGLVAIGAPDPCLTSQGELDIRLRFQYWYYSKQNPPPNWVRPTPLQFSRYIYSIATTSGDPLLMAESYIIIITYFSLLRLG